MEKTYWLRRKRAALAMARAATYSEMRLAHYARAGRHSVRAAFAPFMLPEKGPLTEGEQEALRVPGRPPAPRSNPRSPLLPRGHKPGGAA